MFHYSLNTHLYYLGPSFKASGAVNLSVYHLLVMHYCKQVEPVFDMVKVAPCFPAWKIVIKSFCPVLDVLHGPFNQAFLKWWNEYDGSVSGTGMPADTMCHHPLKQDVFHEP